MATIAVRLISKTFKSNEARFVIRIVFRVALLWRCVCLLVPGADDCFDAFSVREERTLAVGSCDESFRHLETCAVVVVVVFLFQLETASFRPLDVVVVRR